MPGGCTLSLHPPTAPSYLARRRLHDNHLGDDAEQALSAAARSGLQLELVSGFKLRRPI